MQMNIRGIRHTETGRHLSCRYTDTIQSLFPDLLESLARKEINIDFLSYRQDGGAVQLTVSVPPPHFETARYELQKRIGEKTGIETGARVMLSFFSHSADIRYAGIALSCLASENIPFFSLATSLSTMVVSLDAEKTGAAICALQKRLTLPPNPTPVFYGEDPEALREIIARYRETKIKIYGLFQEAPLFLLKTDFPPGRLTGFAAELLESQISGNRFSALFMDRFSDVYNCGFLFPQRTEMKEMETEDALGSIRFQGPHFAERSGIASIVSQVVFDGRFSVRWFVCCGQSIQIVIPENQMRPLTEALSVLLEIPSGGSK